MNISLVAKSVLVMWADWSVEMVLNLSIMSDPKGQTNDALFLADVQHTGCWNPV